MVPSSKIIPSYTIIELFTVLLTSIESKSAPPPTLTFRLNLSFLQNCHAIDDLSLNQLPVTLSLRTQNKNAKRQYQIALINWNTFAKNCSRFKINQKLTTTADIDKSKHSPG